MLWNSRSQTSVVLKPSLSLLTLVVYYGLAQEGGRGSAHQSTSTILRHPSPHASGGPSREREGGRPTGDISAQMSPVLPVWPNFSGGEGEK